MSEIILRKYKPDDESALKNIVKDANPNYIKNLTEDLADINQHKNYTVAEYNGVTAGYLWLSISPGNCQAFIFVSPEYRRRRIGTVLCNEASRLCREKGEKEMWSMYYEYDVGKGFADKVGCYFTTSSVYMQYTGGVLPKHEKFKNIRKCKEEDQFRCSYLWNKGFYELQVRVGNPGAKMLEPTETEEDKKNFATGIDNSYVIEENGQIIGYGVISGNEIGALAVDTELNNRGYGTILTAFMTNEILKRGNVDAYLWVESENANARHVYEKLGYREIETCYTSYKKLN